MILLPNSTVIVKNSGRVAIPSALLSLPLGFVVLVLAVVSLPLLTAYLLGLVKAQSCSQATL